jgi:hypothetical protein
MSESLGRTAAETQKPAKNTDPGIATMALSVHVRSIVSTQLIKLPSPS